MKKYLVNCNRANNKDLRQLNRSNNNPRTKKTDNNGFSTLKINYYSYIYYSINYSFNVLHHFTCKKIDLIWKKCAIFFSMIYNTNNLLWNYFVWYYPKYFLYYYSRKTTRMQFFLNLFFFVINYERMWIASNNFSGNRKRKNMIYDRGLGITLPNNGNLM